MDKDRYSVDVNDYNRLLDDAFKAIGQLNWRLESWKDHAQKKMMVGLQGEEETEFKKKVQQRQNQFEENYSKRKTEIDALWDLMEQGEQILQAIIEQKAQHYSSGYKNGFQAAVKQSTKTYSEKMVSPKWEGEKYRARREFETIQKWPNLY